LGVIITEEESEHALPIYGTRL